MMGSARVGSEMGFSSLLSFVLEANFVNNSFYKVIELIKEQGYNFTYGIELLGIPFSALPGWIFPQKYSLIDPGEEWANRALISPQGAYFGLAHLYRYGGLTSIILISIGLGFLLGTAYRRFVKSWDGQKYDSLYYPIAIFPFLFHYVRDDFTVAVKICIQIGIVLFLYEQVCKFLTAVTSRKVVTNSELSNGIKCDA